MKTVFTLWLLAASSAVQAMPACPARTSPTHTVPLIELYTSEGCDSCPPADAFLSAQPARDAVLLSMHVDYWNRLGWRDPFSRAEISDRQRTLAERAGAATVYTPELFVAGRELRGGPQRWGEAMAAHLARLRGSAARAAITLEPAPAQAGRVPVGLRVRAPAGSTVMLALVQSTIAVQVGAGENRGRLLRHDHVVRDWAAPLSVADGALVQTRSLQLPAGVPPARLTVAAFVEGPQGEVLQALEVPLCGS